VPTDRFSFKALLAELLIFIQTPSVNLREMLQRHLIRKKLAYFSGHQVWGFLPLSNADHGHMVHVHALQALAMHAHATYTHVMQDDLAGRSLKADLSVDTQLNLPLKGRFHYYCSLK
jgi:hypothetical protein